MAETAITHAELVQRLDPWGREQGYQWSLPEPRHPYVPEEPDRLFATWYGHTAIAEAKVSRSDWKRDQHKPHRQKPGLGQRKWLACPEGLIEPHEVDDDSGWGLLWWRLRTEQFEVMVDAPVWRAINHQAEKALMMQAIRNLERQSGTTAQEARPSQKNNVPEKYHGLIRGALRETGEQKARWLVNYALPDWEPKSPKTNKTRRLAAFALDGGIEGVEAENRGGITYLRLRAKDGEGDE